MKRRSRLKPDLVPHCVRAEVRPHSDEMIRSLPGPMGIAVSSYGVL